MADKTPAQITAEYEAIKNERTAAIQRKIDKLFNDLIAQLSPLAAAQALPSGVFTFKKLAVLNNLVNKLIRDLTSNIEIITQNGIADMWALSNRKNDLIADIRLDKSVIPDNKQVAYYNPNKAALERFEARQVNGLKLSDRIYNTTQQLRNELEAGVGLGISEGQGAAEMGRSLKKYLKRPDDLFRRVKDAKGTLQLSTNAKAFNPGRGVYRSATKNVERLTRTENNMAYRSADMERYKTMPFVIGYEVKLSASHPRFDMCDGLKGKYPVGFIFVGWHPQCLCFCIPLLMTDDQFIKYQNMVLAGTDSPAAVAKITGRVMEIPPGASKWIDDNKERVSNWKSVPYFIKDNPKYI